MNPLMRVVLCAVLLLAVSLGLAWMWDHSDADQLNARAQVQRS
jgi:hypothetical protein